MALFDAIMGALNNPNQQANPDQLGSIVNTVQQMTQQQGVDLGTSQMVLSMLGGYVRSALQQKQAAGNSAQAAEIVNQFGGTGSNPAAVQAVFSPDQQQQVSSAIAQRTGLSPAVVQGLLATLVPIVLNMLQTGATTQGNQGRNTVLDAFLDSNRDGNVDIGDAISMAGQFLNQRR